MKLFLCNNPYNIFGIKCIDPYICTKRSTKRKASRLDVTFASILCVTEVNDVLGSTISWKYAKEKNK